MTHVDSDDILKPGGMQRLLDEAAGDEPGRAVILCENHVPSVEMQRLDDAAVCPTCGVSIRLAWIPDP